MFTLSMCRDPKSVSDFLKRCSISHKRTKGFTFWDMYQQTFATTAWVTTNYRFIGVGDKTPTVSLKPNEYLVSFKLPWNGCGRDVTQLLNSATRQIERNYDPEHFLVRGRKSGKLTRTLALK